MKQMIICEDAKQAQEVTQLLMKGGIFWAGKQEADYASDFPFGRIVDVDIFYSSTITSITKAISYANSRGYQIIRATQFIETPTIINEWKLSVAKKGDFIKSHYKGWVYFMTSNVNSICISGEHKGWPQELSGI